MPTVQFNLLMVHRLLLGSSKRAVVLVLGMAVACRPWSPSSPPETAAQFYTLIDGLGVRGVPDSVVLEVVRPYLDTTLVRLLTEARHEREIASHRAPDEKPPFVEGDMFSSLFEGTTSFTLRAVTARGDTTFATMAFTNSMQPPTVRWTDTLVIVPRPNVTPRSPQFVIVDLRYGGDWDFANRGTLLGNLRAVLDQRAARNSVSALAKAAG